jgi:hypothetical protein
MNDLLGFELPGESDDQRLRVAAIDGATGIVTQQFTACNQMSLAPQRAIESGYIDAMRAARDIEVALTGVSGQPTTR